MGAVGALLLGSSAVHAANYAWPANYQGVMLQGFYWDSYTDTKWTNLEAQAEELSKYFSLIWVPNSAKSASGYMGYDPVYWFTNHTTKFGNETELRNMIATYKALGVGIIEDVVINHRSGVSNWTNFPAEKWRGETYQIGVDGICCNDEVAYASGQAKPTGAYDTGENFDGSRDLDHTNANVQKNCKAYCTFLLEDLGYAGFRYDMVKGYAPAYTKMYNEASKPRFSVGEYWDGNYDKVKEWIEGTGKQSAAFDFPFKYAVNEAFSSGDMTKLVWKANGTTDQPAGMIHFGYPQYAVTFIDNHDTYRDGSKFNGNVVAANAFMLCSPGTPCVFLPHYKEHKAAIQALIKVRNDVGVHNMSAVKVLQSSRDCYMAEVTGTKGKLVVKIGGSMASPSGYSNSDIRATGKDYCVWAKTTGGGGGGDDPVAAMTVYFDNSSSKWTTPHIHYWGASESVWPGVAMTLVSGNIWKYDLPAGTTGILFNAGDGDATKTEDFVPVANHVYTTAGDQGQYSGGGGGGGDDPVAAMTVYFDNSSSKWTTPHIHYWGASESVWPGVAMTLVSGNIWKYDLPAGTTGILFNAGDGDATKTEDFVPVANHVYTTAGDQGQYSGGGGGGDDPAGPAHLYIVGNLLQGSWNTETGVIEGTKNGTVFTFESVTLVDAAATGDSGDSYFSFITTKGADWDEVNGSDRYGAPAADEPVIVNTPLQVQLYKVNVDASAAASWKTTPGSYSMKVDVANLTLTVNRKSDSLTDVAVEQPAAAEYYNLQGVRVHQPGPGMYIVRRGTKVTKEILR